MLGWRSLLWTLISRSICVIMLRIWRGYFSTTCTGPSWQVCDLALTRLHRHMPTRFQLLHPANSCDRTSANRRCKAAWA